MSDLYRILFPVSGTIEQKQDAEAGREMRVSSRRSDFVAGLPVKESESVQLGRGTGEYISRRFVGRDLVVMPFRVAPKLAIHTVPKKDWVVLLMRLNRRSDFVFNGCVARPFDLCLSAGPDGYMTTGEDRCNIAIGIRKTRLTSACSALAGVGAEDVRLRDLILPREQVMGERLCHGLVGVAAQCNEEPLSEGRFAMPEALENDLTCMLAARLVPAVRRVPEVNPLRLNVLRVVHAATAVTRALPAACLGDLCAAAGVSQRWLHKCFAEVLGVSPYQYIRLARLSKARDMLLACESSPSLVKSISLSVGYRLSGRFAAEYRSVYGMNPSDTLRGSRQL
jgi:AraC-like DNA-binding protein